MDYCGEQIKNQKKSVAPADMVTTDFNPLEMHHAGKENRMFGQ